MRKRGGRFRGDVDCAVGAFDGGEVFENVGVAEGLEAGEGGLD